MGDAKRLSLRACLCTALDAREQLGREQGSRRREPVRPQTEPVDLTLAPSSIIERSFHRNIVAPRRSRCDRRPAKPTRFAGLPDFVPVGFMER